MSTNAYRNWCYTVLDLLGYEADHDEDVAAVLAQQTGAPDKAITYFKNGATAQEFVEMYLTNFEERDPRFPGGVPGRTALLGLR